ncbi:UPF0758 domain-containing protein [Prevotella communis]|uniref:UPF0758 domain-containing protein n=1 Tax=Prevotella communis TaxID=2913614 RepID=UPI003D695722
MERLGAQALSDAELLAILIGSGSPREDAVSLMKRILADCNNNLNTLGKMSIRDLCQYNRRGTGKGHHHHGGLRTGQAADRWKVQRRGPTWVLPRGYTTTCIP